MQDRARMKDNIKSESALQLHEGRKRNSYAAISYQVFDK